MSDIIPIEEEPVFFDENGTPYTVEALADAVVSGNLPISHLIDVMHSHMYDMRTLYKDYRRLEEKYRQATRSNKKSTYKESGSTQDRIWDRARNEAARIGKYL